jgi:nicotinamide riboside kinase
LKEKLAIGFCGAPSSNKTTLSHLLRWQLAQKTKLSRELPREYARHYMEKYGAIESIHQQLLIYDGQTKSEKQITDNYNIMITDSPRFLSYVYAKRFLHYKDPHNVASLVRLYELAVLSLSDYDIIYILPPPVDIEMDGIRSQSKEDVMNIFRDSKNFLDTHAPDLSVYLSEYHKDEALKWVDYIINDLIAKKLIANE